MATLLICYFLGGCSPAKYREDIDKTAGQILSEKQYQATGKVGKFTINRPSDILRKRLLKGQNLPMTGPASLGAECLEEIEHWPEEGYPNVTTGGKITNIDVNDRVAVTLVEALQIGAYNSFEYQTRKEDIFQTALNLELERDEFRNSFFAQIQNLVSTDTRGDRTVSGTVTSGSVGISRRFMNGAEVTSAIGIDFANLLTNGGEFSRGLSADLSVTIPLLRGSGRHIVTEPLIQAERNVIYAFWDFEQFKKDFAVDVATNYLSVLQQLDQIQNSEADYLSRIDTARRSRRLSDAGRIKEIEVDQAVQQELSARQSWIRAIQSYKRQLDQFKIFLGLPPDANIQLDPNELKKLIGPAMQMIRQAEQITSDESAVTDEEQFLIQLMEPDYSNAGPYEIPEPNAIQLAFFNRLDLKRAEGQVYDAQRAVVVAADALRAELTLLGDASIGSTRGIGSTGLPNATFVANEGIFSSLVTLDLPLERTLEAVNYRNSYITLERNVRDVQTLEDNIKFDIRNSLRNSLEARENMYIQAKAVAVAQKRVKSVNMFLDAGRAQIRDLLEAQDALLSAQNALTAAIVQYRISELNIQRDMGVLEVDENGLWKEYFPEIN